MCGILGFAGPGASKHAAAFDVALDSIAHRGPDDRGVILSEGVQGDVLLGHRRLSIIDLSAAGHQPMVEEASGAAIVFNGEIYNYLELRSELEKAGCIFRSKSDTEVLLQAYLTWGEDCLRRLNGMWAFAIWLPAQRKLFFARDRFGVKPLYYRHDRSFCFASEPKAILQLFPQSRRPSEQTLAEFLAWGRLYATNDSFYRDVKLVPPAHCGDYRLDDGNLTLRRYWDYPEDGGPPVDETRANEEFGALLDDAVRIRLRSDVPVGITLSGGLDSTAVLAASMKYARSARPCFTAVYGGDQTGEAAWARKAAFPYGIDPIEVAAPQGAWIDLMSSISWHMDGPGYSPAVFPLWTIMAEARRRNVPVLLEGQGADEALAGYPQYMALAIIAGFRQAISTMSAAHWGALSNMSRGAVEAFSSRWVFLWLIRLLLPGLTASYRARVGAGATLQRAYRLPLDDPREAGPGRYADAVNNRLWLDHSARVLPGLLHYGDAISMAHGIESRLPFMDYRLVEWLFSRSARIKVGDGRTKRILRSYLEVSGQPAIAARADKQGFPTPVESWLAQDQGAVAREWLMAPDAKIRAFCDPRQVERLISYHSKGGRGAGNHLYRLLSTELWMRKCLP